MEREPSRWRNASAFNNAIVFVQQLILVLIGQLVFGVDYFRQPVAILLLITVLSFWTASLGLLISAISRKEDQVITLSLIPAGILLEYAIAFFGVATWRFRFE